MEKIVMMNPANGARVITRMFFREKWENLGFIVIMTSVRLSKAS